jgi:chromate reductase
VSSRPRILALSGSPRIESSINRWLSIAADAATSAGGEVTMVNLVDFPLPIYDSDWEAEHGIPENARTLRTFILENHGLLIATPEHNGSYSTLLKNAIDWANRSDEMDQRTESVFAGRAASLILSSTGDCEGLRSEIALHLTLSRLGALVIPTTFVLYGNSGAVSPSAGDAEDCEGRRLRQIGASLAAVTAGLVPDGR